MAVRLTDEQEELVETKSFRLPDGREGTVTGIFVGARAVIMASAGCLHGMYFIPKDAVVIPEEEA